MFAHLRGAWQQQCDGCCHCCVSMYLELTVMLVSSFPDCWGIAAWLGAWGQVSACLAVFSALEEVLVPRNFSMGLALLQRSSVTGAWMVLAPHHARNLHHTGTDR